MERVSLVIGKTPIIFVCPHGGDNPALARLVEEAAFFAESNAVINRGFKRGPVVDYKTETADLNRIDHCLLENVILEEFLRPIIRIKNRLKKKNFKKIFVYVVGYLTPPAPEEVDLVIGYGNGENYTSTCPTWVKELHVTALRHLELKPYEAHERGTLTGSAPTSVNQLFKVYDYDKEVMSMCLWLNSHLVSQPKTTASRLADAAVELTKHKTYSSKPVRLPIY